MELPAITRTLLAAKKMKGLTFADLGTVVDRDEVWVAALCYRQATASPEEAQKLVAALGLAPEVAQELSEFPTKGLGPVVPDRSPHLSLVRDHASLRPAAQSRHSGEVWG